MKGMFCPSCGSTEGPFFKGLCKKCFLAQQHLIQVPAEIKIEHCKQCNRIKLEGKWVEQSEQALKEFLMKKIKLKELQEAKLSIELEFLDGNTLAIVGASGLLEGNRIGLEAKTLFVPVAIQCNDCTLLSSNYFEATLQIRFLRKAEEKEKQAVLHKINELLRSMKGEDMLASIVAVLDKKNGFDVLLASNNAAKRVVKALSAKTKERVKRSSSVIGRDRKGKEKKRFTYCIRF